MKKKIVYFVLLLCCACTNLEKHTISEKVTLTKAELLDKVKGGWAGQTIGCTYGGPTEFLYNGTMIQDYVPILWPKGHIKHYFDVFPGLYDDVYMDLTFVEVYDRLGLDAPVDSFAYAFAYADYILWHANQQARYNIQNGIMPPLSGHWLNNPHADDLDFQIESDFAGIMSPGMPNSATEITDKIGHIMNYGDGWYGGAYISAMYSLAYVSNDINFIVSEALKVIPSQSIFHQCMADVITWHKQYPQDWKMTWYECEKKWSSEVGCPDGVFKPFNIDAMINSAYIIIGLLYGQGDFFKTMDISTRCGQDSDCNPSNAAGILGVMMGYSNIPKYWMDNLHEVEDINFAYTPFSLNKTYQMSFDQALDMIRKYGGEVTDEQVTIAYQTPKTIRYEKGFESLIPTEKRPIHKSITHLEEIEFTGTGVVVMGYVKSSDFNYVAELECYIDGKLFETAKLPCHSNKRRDQLFWNYELPKSTHTLTFKWLNPAGDAHIQCGELLIYSDMANKITHQ